MEYQNNEHVIPTSNSEYSKLNEFLIAFIKKLLQVMWYFARIDIKSKKMNNKDLINIAEQLSWPLKCTKCFYTLLKRESNT